MRALLFLLLLCVGCPRVAVPVERPRVSLSAVQITARDTEVLTVLVELTLANPNAKALHLRALDWEIGLDEELSARGRTAVDVLLSPRRQRTVHIPLAIPAALARTVAPRRYRLRGVLHAWSDNGDIAAVFAEVGAVQ